MPASRAGAFERRPKLRTLVLNAGYEPLAVVSFKRALVLVIEGKASLLAYDEGNPVLSATGEWERPSVILLRRYVRIPSGRNVPVSRRGVLRRDGQRCAYCSALGLDDRPRHPAFARRGRLVGEPRGMLPAMQQRQGRPHPARDGLDHATDSARSARHGVAGPRRRASRAALGRVPGARRMSTVWEVPVATRDERGAGSAPAPVPRIGAAAHAARRPARRVRGTSACRSRCASPARHLASPRTDLGSLTTS